MKVVFMFGDCWEGMEVGFRREVELGFLPVVGMRFDFEPRPFELFVEGVMWFHDGGELLVSFDCPQHGSKGEFIEAVKIVIACGEWGCHANEKGRQVFGLG